MCVYVRVYNMYVPLCCMLYAVCLCSMLWYISVETSHHRLPQGTKSRPLTLRPRDLALRETHVWE